ncbi:DUF6308 family protein [Williamsia muralis]|uniref:DUF6308 family protein n=1 Tax=Williamsia marianensis TaxID=85044 RepID=UPI00351D53D3
MTSVGLGSLTIFMPELLPLQHRSTTDCPVLRTNLRRGPARPASINNVNLGVSHLIGRHDFSRPAITSTPSRCCTNQLYRRSRQRYQRELPDRRQRQPPEIRAAYRVDGPVTLRGEPKNPGDLGAVVTLWRMTIAAWTMPEVLHKQHSDQAAALLRRYFDIGTEGQPNFTGSMFERFDGGGDAPHVVDRFTAADMVAVSMLSVDVPAGGRIAHPRSRPAPPKRGTSCSATRPGPGQRRRRAPPAR